MAAVETQTKKRGYNLRLVIVIVIALFMMMLTTMFFTYMMMNKVFNPIGAGAREIKPITYEAGEILTNLSDEGYIKLSMVYLLDNEKVLNEITKKDYQIRDDIFCILRAKKLNEVKDSKGMEGLRAEIKESINKILTQGQILDVYFTSIIVN